METSKAALKGGSKKFQYILTDGASKVADIDGDEFAECDYGLVLDNSNESQRLEEGLLQLAHAAMQNQMMSFGAMMKVLSSPSMAEVHRIIEKDEKDMNERKSKEVQDNMKMQQAEIQYRKDVKKKKIQLEDTLNQRDNETRILIAEMSNQIDQPEDTSKEDLALKIKKYRKLRWDTILIGIEIITVIILGLLPSSVPDQVFQVTINFICAMQFNTFRQAEKVGMATTFVTNHIRQTGSFFVRWLRKRHEKKYLNRSLRHLCMILCFIAGAIFSTVLCAYFKDRAIWGALIFLVILQGDLLYADLVKEKELLDQVPNGH